MTYIKRYAYIFMILLALCVAGYIKLLKDSRSNALYKLEIANTQINQLISLNSDLKGTIDTLVKNAEEDRAFISDLEKKRKETEDKANSELNTFKRAKRESQNISDWANQPLPLGLY